MSQPPRQPASVPPGRRRIEWQPGQRGLDKHLLPVADALAAEIGCRYSYEGDLTSSWNGMVFPCAIDLDWVLERFEFAPGIRLGVDRDGDAYIVDRRHRTQIVGIASGNADARGDLARLWQRRKLADVDVVGTAAAIRAKMLDPPPLFGPDGRQYIAERPGQERPFEHLLPVVEAEKSWGNTTSGTFMEDDVKTHRPYVDGAFWYGSLTLTFNKPLHVDRLVETFDFDPDIWVAVQGDRSAAVSDPRADVFIDGAAPWRWPRTGVWGVLAAWARGELRPKPAATGVRVGIAPVEGQSPSYLHLVPVLESLCASGARAVYTVRKDGPTGWLMFSFAGVSGFEQVLEHFEFGGEIEIGQAPGDEAYLIDHGTRAVIWNERADYSALVPYRSRHDRQFAWLEARGRLATKGTT